MKQITSYILLLFFIQFNVLSAIDITTTFSTLGGGERCCSASKVSDEGHCSVEIQQDTENSHSDEENGCSDESDECFCMQCACCHAPMYLTSECISILQTINHAQGEFFYASPHFFPTLSEVWQPPKQV